MPDFTDHSTGAQQHIPIQQVAGISVVTLQVALSRDLLTALRENLLQALHGSSDAVVILDCSGLPVIDPHEFEQLRRIADMAGLMGAQVVIAGLQAGVVATLVAIDAPIQGLSFARNLDYALKQKGLILSTETEVDNDP